MLDSGSILKQSRNEPHTYISSVAYSGRGRKSPLETNWNSSCDDCISANGTRTWENISHVVSPNDHTSEAVENSNDFNDSGAIHLQGTGIYPKQKQQATSSYKFQTAIGKVTWLQNQAFNSHLTGPAINSGRIQLPRKTKVCEFYHKIREHEDVPGSKISMNNLKIAKVRMICRWSHAVELTLFEAMYSIPAAICSQKLIKWSWLSVMVEYPDLQNRIMKHLKYTCKVYTIPPTWKCLDYHLDQRNW